MQPSHYQLAEYCVSVRDHTHTSITAREINLCRVIDRCDIYLMYLRCNALSPHDDLIIFEKVMCDTVYIGAVLNSGATCRK